VFDTVEKSSKFLLEIITLVSSVSKMGSDKTFVVEVGHLCILQEAKAPKLTPGELNVLLFPIVRIISQMILFQFLVLYLSGSKPISYCSLNAIIM
jgi:hypothetical protein